MKDNRLIKLIEQESSVGKNEIVKIDYLSKSSLVRTMQVRLQNNKKLFIKRVDIGCLERLEHEEESLKALRSFSNQHILEIPKPIGIQKDDHSAILIMPWIDFGEGTQEFLGKGLALIHKNSSDQHQKKFGWGSNGFIGEGKQKQGWKEDWGQFFVDFRLLPQFQTAQSWGLKIQFWEKIRANLITKLNKHDPLPSLVHGDLWYGNAGITTDGKAIIFDPATYWGDRETDIAMTKLFGGFSHNFYKSYEEVWPLPETSKERVDIYNLFHVVNHANIFGGSYKIQSQQILDKLQ